MDTLKRTRGQNRKMTDAIQNNTGNNNTRAGVGQKSSSEQSANVPRKNERDEGQRDAIEMVKITTVNGAV